VSNRWLWSCLLAYFMLGGIVGLGVCQLVDAAQKYTSHATQSLDDPDCPTTGCVQ